jgi:hypothetical protein
MNLDTWMMTKKEQKMSEVDNREILEVLRRIEKQLIDLNFGLADIKKELPKVPYYGDLLKDIVTAIEDKRR